MYDDKPDDVQLPAMRPSVGSEGNGTTKAVPELPPGEMGHAVKVRGTSRSEDRPDATAVVYFVATLDGAFVKIGYADNFWTRLPALRTIARKRYGQEIEVLGFFPGHTGTENWLQCRFADFRDHGDWFQFDPRIRRFINWIFLVPPEASGGSTKITFDRVRKGDNHTSHALRERITDLEKGSACSRKADSRT